MFNRPKSRRITVLGVSILASLGLMAFSAVGAQAASWTVDGKALSGIQTASFESAGGSVTISGSGVQFECAEQRSQGTLFSGGASESHILLIGCVVVGGEEQCQFGQEEIHLYAAATLSKDGDQTVSTPQGGYFGNFTLEDVAPYECPLYDSGQGSQSVELGNSFTTAVGSDGVEVPLSTSSKGLFVGLWGMENSHIEGTGSMWLTGADAGKVLGAS